MMMRTLSCLLLSLLLSAAVQAQITPGDYTPLLIGVDSQTKVITGYFNERSGQDQQTGKAQFSCLFFLRGQMTGQPPFRVQTWYPADKHKPTIINGLLWPASEGKQPAVRLKLDQEPGGCWNATAYRLAAKNGAIIPLEQAEKWQAVRIVAAQKTYLYDSAEQQNKGKRYLLKGDAVLISESRNNRVRITYLTGDNRRINGWVDSRDLFSDRPGQ